MNHSLRHVLRSAVSVTTALSLSAFGLATTALAGQLTNTSVTMSDATASSIASYTLAFSGASSTAVKRIKLQFTTTPSGTAVRPTTFDSSSAGMVAVTYNNGSAGTFELTTAAPTVNSVDLTNASGAGGAGNWLVTLSNIHNQADGDGCDAVAGSESCFVRVSTYSDSAGSTLLDSSVASFTAVSPITVSATVDPYMTFSINGVTNAMGTADPKLGAATQVTGTTGTLIPFGNVAVGTPKVAMQSLDVRTNAGGGYDVFHKFTTANDRILTGSAGGTANKVDKFVGAAGTTTFASPTAWASPTGTAANTNSAWVGIRTTGTGTGIGAFNGGANGLFGPPASLNDATGNKVKTLATPDNGTSATTTYVSLQLEANAYQPADSYSGTMVYNVVAKY